MKLVEHVLYFSRIVIVVVMGKHSFNLIYHNLIFHCFILLIHHMHKLWISMTFCQLALYLPRYLPPGLIGLNIPLTLCNICCLCGYFWCYSFYLECYRSWWWIILFLSVPSPICRGHCRWFHILMNLRDRSCRGSFLYFWYCGLGNFLYNKRSILLYS